MKKKTRTKAALQARDLERIDKAAERLNHEATEVLDYQALCEERLNCWPFAQS